MAAAEATVAAMAKMKNEARMMKGVECTAGRMRGLSRDRDENSSELVYMTSARCLFVL